MMISTNILAEVRPDCFAADQEWYVYGKILAWRCSLIQRWNMTQNGGIANWIPILLWAIYLRKTERTNESWRLTVRSVQISRRNKINSKRIPQTKWEQIRRTKFSWLSVRTHLILQTERQLDSWKIRCDNSNQSVHYAKQSQEVKWSAMLL